MKKNIIYVLLSLVLMTIWGCTTKSNMQPEGNWDLSNPTLKIPSADENIVLNEIFPTETIDFEWKESVNSADYIITYAVVLVRDTATSYENPLLEVEANNSGKDVTASISHAAIDMALTQGCYSEGQIANVKWGVKAKSLAKVSYTDAPIAFTRFAKNQTPSYLYLFGTATEAGNDQEQAIPLKGFQDAEGNVAYFETVTQLIKDETYEFVSALEEPALHFGIDDGQLTLCGPSITATEDGVFRIAVDLVNKTLSTEKINHLGIVGTPIEGEWGGDVALPYLGNGLFQDTVALLKQGGFVLRLDGDWGRMYKQTPGTTSLIYEPYADAVGHSKEDLQNANLGDYIVSVDFIGSSYSYSFEEIETDIIAPDPIDAPEKLFLIPSDGSNAIALIKEGNVFTSPYYLALQTAVTYTLNSAVDGTGTAYSALGSIGESENPDGDKVSGSPYFVAEEGNVMVQRDQAYQLKIDFDAPTIEWQYYNIKLFHWDDNGGWDDKLEVLMTYEHPYTFKVENQALQGGLDSKFFSPWDVEFGVSGEDGSTDNATATQGTATNKKLPDGGEVDVANFKFISSDGNYTIELEIANDYKTAVYSIN